MPLEHANNEILILPLKIEHLREDVVATFVTGVARLIFDHGTRFAPIRDGLRDG